MLKRSLIILLITLLIFGGLFGLKFHQINQSALAFKPPPPPIVAVTEVLQEDWPSTITAVGSFVAVAGIDVSSEVTGIVKAIHFESGQTVKKGQLLLELDASTDRAELGGLEAELRFAEVRFDRSAQLIDKKYIAKSDYDQNKALLEEAIAAVQTKKTLIDKKMIQAPFDGEIGIRQVNLGQYLAPGSAIVSLQKLDPIYIDFTVPERDLSGIKINQQITASIQAYPEQVFTGKISAVSPALDQDSRSVKIRAVLSNKMRNLRPGMFAQVNILSQQPLKVLTLPDTAITYNPYGSTAFVVVSGEQGLTVQNRQVETGITKAGRVQIVKGLIQGEKVVSAGQVKLRNGMPVTLDNKPAPGERERQP
jgi:membrane fusion protein, multidrug efflux system